MAEPGIESGSDGFEQRIDTSFSSVGNQSMRLSPVDPSLPPNVKIEMVEPELDGDPGVHPYHDEYNGRTVWLHQAPLRTRELTSEDIALERIVGDEVIDSKTVMTHVVGQGRYMCSVCHKCFLSEDSLYVHLFRECGKDLQMKCIHCSFRTEFVDDMRSHITLKHRDSPGPSFNSELTQFHNEDQVGNRQICTRCGETYTLVEEHLKCCGKIRKFKCSVCYFETEWESQLKRHYRQKHSLGTMDRPSCTKCGKSYMNHRCLRKHMKYCGNSSHEIVKFKCAHCFYDTKWKNDLKRHIMTKHPVEITERLICTACGKSYKHKDSLKDHLSRHCEKTNSEFFKHKCIICNYETKWVAQIKQHFRTDHPTKSFIKLQGSFIYRPTCIACGKSLKNEEGLKHHMKYCEKLNNEIVKHKCLLCNYETKWKAQLKQHLKHCGKWSSEMLKYKCYHCLYETKWKHSLRRHIVQRHPVEVIERLICPACGKSSKNKDSLKKHMKYCEKLNHEIVKHKCKLCDYETKWETHLKRHIRHKHVRSLIVQAESSGSKTEQSNMVTGGM